MPIAVTVPRWNTAASAHLALIEHMSIAVTAAHWNSDAAADVTFVERNAAIRNAIASNCFRLGLRSGLGLGLRRRLRLRLRLRPLRGNPR